MYFLAGWPALWMLDVASAFWILIAILGSFFIIQDFDLDTIYYSVSLLIPSKNWNDLRHLRAVFRTVLIGFGAVTLPMFISLPYCLPIFLAVVNFFLLISFSALSILLMITIFIVIRRNVIRRNGSGAFIEDFWFLGGAFYYLVCMPGILEILFLELQLISLIYSYYEIMMVFLLVLSCSGVFVFVSELWIGLFAGFSSHDWEANAFFRTFYLGLFQYCWFSQSVLSPLCPLILFELLAFFVLDCAFTLWMRNIDSDDRIFLLKPWHALRNLFLVMICQRFWVSILLWWGPSLWLTAVPLTLQDFFFQLAWGFDICAMTVCLKDLFHYFWRAYSQRDEFKNTLREYFDRCENIPHPPKISLGELCDINFARHQEITPGRAPSL